ncbi:Hemolymph protein 14, partial [Operophtera brumata]
RAELPWHALIYKKTFTPYVPICGGSLISTTVVLSVAHCFWTENEKQLPASQFAVAVGKLHRPWNDPTDEAQKSDMAIWAPHPSDEKASQTLQVIEIPYMDVRTCINTSPIDFRAYITSDQFCAGTQQCKLYVSQYI